MSKFSQEFVNESARTLRARMKDIRAMMPSVPLFAPSCKKEAEVANDDMSIDIDVKVHDGRRKELIAIENALDRIACGTWGICVDCEEEIAEKRLRATPLALKCIVCAERNDDHRHDRTRSAFVGVHASL